MPLSSNAHLGPKDRQPHSALRKSVDRPALVRRALDKARGGVLIVQAPPGFGKTCLLADLFAQVKASNARTVWVRPDRGRGGRFLQVLAAELSGDAGKPVEVEDICERLDASPTDAYVFVDDYDRVLTGPEMTAIDRILEAPSRKVRFVLAGRTRPQCSVIGEFLLRGQAQRIGWRELSFGQREMRELLPDLNEQKLETLARFTKGWPAMVRIGALLFSESNLANRNEIFERFIAGDNDLACAYVYDTVIPSFRPYAAETLRLAGFLDSCCPDLVRAMGIESAGQTGGQSALSEAEPLVERADRKGWHRFHPAIAAVLRSTFERQAEATRQRLHLAAARWFSEHELIEKAVFHAVEAQDFGLAENCIRQAGSVRIFLQFGFPTLHRLMEQLPTEVILQSAALQLCQAVVFGKQGQLESARDLVDAVAEAAATTPEVVDVLPDDIHHIDTLIAIYEDRIADPDQITVMRQEAKSTSPRSLWRTGWIANHMCAAHTARGNLAEAESEAHKALACYREISVYYGQIFMLLHLGLITLDRGKPISALEFLREADGLIERTQSGDKQVPAILQAPMAQALCATGASRRAGQLLDSALATLPSAEAWVDIYQRAYETRARIAVLDGETELALRLVDQVEQVASRRRLNRLELFSKLLRMDVTLRAGLTEAAIDIASSFEWMADGDWPPGAIYVEQGRKFTWREWHRCLITMARVRWAQNRRDEAVTYLERLCRSAKTFDAGLDLATATALLFSYQWHLKRSEEAKATFQLAVALATPQKLVAVFSDEGYSMAVAIRGLLRGFGASAFSRASIEFTNDVLSAHMREEVRLQSGTDHGRIEFLLSDHEHEILEHLVRGLSNKAIAIRIGRTEATVKYHLRRIYTKFGVNSRANAIVIAKDMGIVS